ncbi:MAG: 2-amino-4-hydroxy-6-hydroxymethyldihydropteridine diphosphokinase [Muribaculaceae bacterium]|nr:2-amino-4-hydroxy-6-hydroxymethyldihydropteridine diphosphokinase [Muribaculaceae bacterium]
MATIYHLSLGSNCGDRHVNIRAAIDWLDTIAHVEQCSAIYETDSINGDGTKYCNCVLICSTELDVDKLDKTLKEYEIRAGRTAACRERGEVPIDLDIVIADGKIIRPRDYARSYFTHGLHLITTTTPN